MAKFTIFGTTAAPANEIGKITQGLGLGDTNRGLVPIDLGGGGGGGGGLIGIEVFVGPLFQAYTPLPGAATFYIEIVSNGGAGGSANATTIGYSAGSGGGASSYAAGFFTLAQLGAGPTIALSGPALAVTGAKGGDGQESYMENASTVFHLYANGGKGGLLGVIMRNDTEPKTNFTLGGAGGVPEVGSQGSLEYSGAAGGYGTGNAGPLGNPTKAAGISGAGASGPLGTGGAAAVNGGSMAGQGYGSGGGGSLAIDNESNTKGADSAPGAVRIFTFGA